MIESLIAVFIAALAVVAGYLGVQSARLRPRPLALKSRDSGKKPAPPPQEIKSIKTIAAERVKRGPTRPALAEIERTLDRLEKELKRRR